MKKEVTNNSSDSLVKIAGNNKDLAMFKNDILSYGKESALDHKIEFRRSGVKRILTPDSDETLYVEYNDDKIRGFNIETGECFLDNDWAEGNSEFKSEGQFVFITPGFNNSLLKVFNLNKRQGMYTITRHKGRIIDTALMSDNSIITIAEDPYGYAFSSKDLEHRMRYERLFPFNDFFLQLKTTALTVYPFNNSVIIAYNDGVISLFDLHHLFPYGHIVLGDQRLISGLAASKEYVFAAIENEVLGFANNEILEKNYRAPYPVSRVEKYFRVPYPVSKVSCFVSDFYRASPNWFDYYYHESEFMNNLLFVSTIKGPIFVFNIKTQKLERVIEGHNEQITDVLFAPNHYIFSSSIDGSVRRYDYKNKKCINIYYKNDGCRSLDLLEDKKMMCVSGVIDNKAKILDLETGVIKHEFLHQDSIRVVKFQEVLGKQYLFTAGWDRKVIQWDYDTGDLIRSFDSPGRICDIQFSKDGKLFVGFYSRDKLGGFQIIDMATGVTITTIMQHPSRERFGRVVVVCLDDNVLYTAGDDGVINKWDSGYTKIVRSIETSYGVRTLCIDNELQLLYSGHDDSYVRVWELKSLKLIDTLKENPGAVYSFVLSKNYLFAGDHLGLICKYDRYNRKFLQSTNLHKYIVWKLDVTSDENILISTSEEGKVGFISIKNMEEIGEYYNISGGFLWTAAGDDNKKYYWTNRLENIKVYEQVKKNDKIEKKNDDLGVKEYHSIYNKQKIVMGRIGNSRFYEVYNAAKNHIKHKSVINKILEFHPGKLLK